jgi:hypothetical protein
MDRAPERPAGDDAVLRRPKQPAMVREEADDAAVPVGGVELSLEALRE